MSISSFSSPVQTSLTLSGVVNKLAAVTGTPDITVPLSSAPLSSAPQAWAYGSGAAYTCNNVVRTVFTATKNTTTTLDLSGSLANVLSEAATTFTVIKRILFEYLTVAQDSVNGTASTGTVTIQPGASNPITTSPLGAAQTYKMTNGDKWLCEKGNIAGITVAGGTADTFDFVHNDTSDDAHFLITVFGDR